MKNNKAARRKKAASKKAMVEEIPALEEEDDEALVEEEEEDVYGEAAEQALRKSLREKKLLFSKLKNQISTVHLGNKLMSLDLEQARIKTVSIWFYILIIPAIVCTLGSWTKGSYFFTGINWFAFLLVWRSLYVKNNHAWFFIASLIMAYTIKFS